MTKKKTGQRQETRDGIEEFLARAVSLSPHTWRLVDRGFERWRQKERDGDRDYRFFRKKTLILIFGIDFTLAH